MGQMDHATQINVYAIRRQYRGCDKAATTTAKILHLKEKTNLLTVKKFLEHDVS